MVLSVCGNAQIPWPIIIKGAIDGVGYICTGIAAYNKIDDFINHTEHESDIRKGITSYNEGNYAQAFAHFNEVDKDDKDAVRVMAHYYKALCRYKQGDFDKAKINVDRAINFKDYDLILSGKGDIDRLQGKARKLKTDIEAAEYNRDGLSLLKKCLYSLAVEKFKKSADMGSPEGCYNLAYCYMKGDGIGQNFSKAFELFKKSNAIQSSDRALEMLGICYFYGVGVRQNYSEAYNHLIKVNAGNRPEAQYLLAYCFYHGKGVGISETQAKKYFLLSAQNGYSQSQVEIGKFYLSGKCGFNKSLTEAFTNFKKAADNNNPEGQYELGMCYLKERGVNKDNKSAAQYFRLSAENGFPEAQYRIAACYEQGVGVDRDIDKAKEWLNKAVKQNNVDAISYLGRCYYNGTLMTQDYKMAVKYFQKVADTDSKAQFFLGECYRLGHGVKKDTKLSLDWFKKASAQGHSGAQVKIGEYYLDQQKNKEAFDYFSKAAKAGDVDGLFYLGLCHEKGIGVKKDMTTAKSWYQKAANKGSDKAKKKLANLK